MTQYWLKFNFILENSEAELKRVTDQLEADQEATEKATNRVAQLEKALKSIKTKKKERLKKMAWNQHYLYISRIGANSGLIDFLV